MSTAIERAAVVGGGAIGASWVDLLVRQGVTVTVCDPDPAVRERITRAFDGRVAVVDDPAEAVQGAEVVFEAGPERLDFKQRLFAQLDAAAPPDCLLTSSSSGLKPTDLQRDCVHPERVLVAHPFNPPDLVPLVEVVGGRRTSDEAVDRTMRILADLGKQPVRLRRELPGHVANRLQAALWREAYYLVQEGAITVPDLDRAISYGPGLRWALLGPLATQHLSGGGGGLRHVLEHLGPPMLQWWADLGEPTLDQDLIDQLVAGVEEEFAGTEAATRQRRDDALRELLASKERLGLS